ncbi:MAG: hypothetical protein OEW15_11685 [Nitrospirota bacterium]|nr:hypothetical protein [Nitrospirota bacterium]
MANQVVVPEGASAQPENNLQYRRHFSLIVTGTNIDGPNGLDLSALHCKFSVKRSSNMTPNCADIRVYNLDQNTALKIKKQYTQVIIQGGYNSNFGVIFKGNIKQVIIGRESATDTFIDLNCGDGDLAYNYAVVNTSIASGSSMADQLKQITAPMTSLQTALGGTQPEFQPTILPRGKTLWGTSRDYLRTFAQQNDLTWSIQNEQVEFIRQQGYAPGEAVVLTSKTGMIGTPQQTNIGVNVVCLMNPLINPGRRIKIDNASVAQLKIDLGNPKDPVNLAPPLTADGVYYALVIEQQGDNRGLDWYSKVICCTVNPSTNPINSVPVSYGP